MIEIFRSCKTDGYCNFTKFEHQRTSLNYLPNAFWLQISLFLLCGRPKTLRNPSKTIDFHQLQIFKLNFLHEKIIIFHSICFYLQNFMVLSHSDRLNSPWGRQDGAREPAYIIFRIWNNILDISAHLMKSSEVSSDFWCNFEISTLQIFQNLEFWNSAWSLQRGIPPPR